MADSARLVRELTEARAWLRALESADVDEAARFSVALNALYVLAEVEHHRRHAIDELRAHAGSDAQVDRALQRADDLRREWHAAVLCALRRYVRGCRYDRADGAGH